jgi:HD-like signal output (HDOD) protein
MICIPERYRAVVQAAHSAKRPLHEVEQEILGVNHATAGAYLLGLWGLPYPIVEAVAYHHNPADIGETTFAVASATALADSLVDSMTDPQTSTIDRAHLENLGVLESLPRWMEIAEQEVGVRN